MESKEVHMINKKELLRGLWFRLELGGWRCFPVLRKKFVRQIQIFTNY